MEGGAGTLLRMEAGDADVVLVVTEPTAKSIEASRRLAEIAADRARVVVVANKVGDEDDVARIRAGLGDLELVAVPGDDAIERADRDGRAPLDVDANAPGVRALVELAGTLVPGDDQPAPPGSSSARSSSERTKNP